MNFAEDLLDIIDIEGLNIAQTQLNNQLRSGWTECKKTLMVCFCGFLTKWRNSWTLFCIVFAPLKCLVPQLGYRRVLNNYCQVEGNDLCEGHPSLLALQWCCWGGKAFMLHTIGSMLQEEEYNFKVLIISMVLQCENVMDAIMSCNMGIVWKAGRIWLLKEILRLLGSQVLMSLMSPMLSACWWKVCHD